MADYGLEYKGATKKESKDGIKSYTLTSDDPLWHLFNDRNDQVPNSSFNDGDRVKDKELGLGRISLSFAKYGSSRSLKTVNADHRIRFMPITKYGSSRSPTTA